MFFASPTKSLINEAWHDFQRRLRWRIYFTLRDGPERPYDPDYAVVKIHNKRPPKLPLFMELGLKMGSQYVSKTIARLTNETTLGTVRKNPFSPTVDKLRKFLYDNNYVITMTDKNLGLAVSERDWLIRNELDLLSDERNYRLLAKEDADTIMSNKCNEMLELANMVEDHVALSELKLDAFFRSKITIEDSGHIYPQFHGIPKIHKKPTGFRPIIPCHSVVFNPAAKFISKELKPIVKSTPSIIHGTKDLFSRLSQVRIDSRRRWFFVTGDVVAYYPNVPLDSCMRIVTSIYEEWLFKDTTGPDTFQHKQDLLKLKIFKRAIEVGNTHLITQHRDKFYEQLNGLAMGVADSPDLANMYASHFEERSGILSLPEVIFYGRYIDDCFGLVYAESADEALNLFKNKVAFDGCVIEWAVSDFGCQFLDAYLYKENGKLLWRPFVKAGNNRERIPWVSHHPLDVKRGVYIGECSRLAVLCSHLENYMEAIKDLNLLYIARGYPEKLVMNWCKKNIQERWEKRFDNRIAEHDEGVLVLKTRFNDVWNWFSATELGNAVTGYWAEWYDRAADGRFTSDPTKPFLPFDPEGDDDLDVHPSMFCRVYSKPGERQLNSEATHLVGGEDDDIVFAPDLRKAGILGRRWIVSRKRNMNLFDFSTTWKKAVFRKLDEAIAEEGGVLPMIQPSDETDDTHGIARSQVHDTDEGNVIQLHRRDSPVAVHPEFGRLA